MSCSILNQSWEKHSKFYFPEETILLNIDNPEFTVKSRLLYLSSVKVSISVLHSSAVHPVLIYSTEVSLQSLIFK